MKKVVFLLSAVLLVGGNAVAQKKNVSMAKAKILSETPDTKGAKDAILPALKDSTTKNLPNTWFVAGEVFKTIYTEQQKVQLLQKKGDQDLMGQSLKSAFDCYVVADSLDRLPDAKGKVKPKFRDRIYESTSSFQRGFTDAGSYYYDKKEFMKALEMFQYYLKYAEVPFLKDKGFEKDTLRKLITYYCGLSATQAERPEIAVKYYEQIKDSMDSQWVYARLCDDYNTLKDTANMVRLLKLGAAKFPKESYYSRSLINFYINKNQMKEALDWINQAIASDSTTAALWNVKGRILENDSLNDEAVKCYEKALKLDPKFADAMGNIGRIYYNQAVAQLDRINNIRDDKLYRQEKAKLKEMFEKPRPYFEKAYEINPDERDYIIALRGIYYNLQMNDKFEMMDNKIKEMKK